MNYFIDECGHSGDLARNSTAPDFGDQPIFTLAAIGITDELALQKEIEELKARHNVRLAELKSSRLADRPGFTLDVARMVCAANVPWFIEVMDKKFTIATYIVTFQLLRPSRGFVEDQGSHFIKNVLADYIFDRAPDRVYTAFVGACRAPSDASLRDQLDALIEFAESAPAEDVQSIALLQLAKDAFDAYRSSVEKGEEDAHKRYLPPFDKGKYGKSVWMLPNQTAFTNIYARINLCEGGRLSSVRLIHDEQHQFDEVIKMSKSIAESLQDLAAQVFSHLIPTFASESRHLFHSQDPLCPSDFKSQMSSRGFACAMRRISSRIATVSPPPLTQHTICCVVTPTRRPERVSIS